MVLKHLSLCMLALAAAGRSETLVKRMGETTERILSKNGVEVGGAIDAEYFTSDLEGKAVDPTRYSYETTQFTSMDLDTRYRPYDFVGARAILRFHQDWQTFFATRSRLVAARWLSMDGNIRNTLGFNVGDFKQKYTPLTLWAPELDLGFEPEIFAEARGRQMEEQFLAGNNRLLQGLNLNLARRFSSPISELRINAIASRVRKSEFLDAGGAQGTKLWGDGDGDGDSEWVFPNSDMDRFFLAGNAEVMALDNVVLGGTYQALLDDRKSYQQAVYGENLRRLLEEAAQQGAIPEIGRGFMDSLSLNGQAKVVARDLRVVAGHGGIDLAGLLGRPNLTIELLGEYALSNESNLFAWHFRRDSSGVAVEEDPDLPGTDGAAMNLHLGVGYARGGSYGIKLEADYLNNEAGFRNPMAQSPTFVGSRIMNTENDLSSGMLYSTFDALNNGVYKFTPGNATGWYQHAPFSKTAYRNEIFSQEQLSAFSGDQKVQMLLPMGAATPNRSGFKTRLSGSWKEALHLVMDFARMEELEGVRVDSLTADPMAFNQMGGGAKLEIGKLAGWSGALDLSASFSRSESERPAVGGEPVPWKLTADLLQVGASWRFFRKWGILGGYQQVSLRAPFWDLVGASLVTFDSDESERHFRLGLEYHLSRRAYFLVSGGLHQSEWKRSQLATSSVPRNPALDYELDFSQTLSQALVKVRF